MQDLPTCACVDSAELSLDRPVWTSDVAPRPLGGVWVSAVTVISDTSPENNESMFVKMWKYSPSGCWLIKGASGFIND